MTAPTTSQNFVEVTSAEHFQQLLSADLQRVSLINFWAPWAEPCKQMNEVVAELAKKFAQLLVLQVSVSRRFQHMASSSCTTGRCRIADRYLGVIRDRGRPDVHHPQGEWLIPVKS